MNRTAQLGAIAVAGPQARTVLERLTDDDVSAAALPPGAHARLTVAGVPCIAIRVGFVGEVAVELHHPRSRGVELLDAVLEAGRDIDLQPFGLDALDVLRLEKGHAYLAQDTLPDDHPAKLGLGWAVAMDKPSFVGKPSLERMAELPLERRLVGVRIDGEPRRGVPLTDGGRVVGRVTSAARSEAVGATIGARLAARDGRRLPGGARGRRRRGAGGADALLRPGGGAAPCLTWRRWSTWRRRLLGVVHASASADALDRLVVPGRARACRVAEDELLLLCARDDADEIVREVRDRLGAGDADALVLDVTDGWAAATLVGARSARGVRISCRRSSSRWRGSSRARSCASRRRWW